MKYINILALFLTFFAVMGCSSSNMNSTPLSPQGNPLDAHHGNEFSESMISSAILGSYELSIDLDSLTADLISSRMNTIGESYIVDGISYFNIAPCSDCLKIKSLALTDDGIELTFLIRHPFNEGDPFKPPTAINRLDLDIFDTALLVKPSETLPDVYPLTGNSAYTGLIHNSDGLTGELDGVLSDDAAIPYVLVVDDNESATETFNEFAMGAEVDFDVIFNITESLNFNLYLTMGYGASARKPQRLNPTYYNPEFNRKSAWKVNVISPNGDDPPQMGNTWNNTDSNTPFDVTVEVFDWQIGAIVNPELADPSEIYAASGVGSVSVEIPGMTSSLVSTSTADSGTGTPADPLIYTLGVPNENLLNANEYIGLVKVIDERTPGIVIFGGETDTLVSSPNGISINWYDIPEFATYQTFTATVVYGCGPITGSITSPLCPTSGINSGQSVDFSAAASSDNGGDPVVIYEWDMDYDGTTFDIDATGADATLGPFINPNCGTPPEDPVTYTVAVRGTDSCVPPNVTVFDTCELTVDNCTPISVGNITLKVNRLGLAGRWAIDDTGPFTIEWTDPAAGYVEYAAYVDTDPSDGLTNNLVEAGTATGLSYTDSATSFPADHYVAGWTYIVRGRTQAGNPLSEGLDSEPAFVAFNGWETLGRFANPGISNNGEGWLVDHETNTGPGIYGLHYPRVYDGDPLAFPAHGIHSVQYSPWCNQNYTDLAGRWNGILTQPPSVADSTVRWIEFELYGWQFGGEDGLTIGTSPQHVFDSYDITSFDWSSSETTGDYYGYNKQSQDVLSFFEDVEPGVNNAWQIIAGPFSSQPRLLGGDCNAHGDPTDPYIGIQYIRATNGGQPYPMLDELAVVVY